MLKKVLKILFIAASLGSLAFVPWPIVQAWLAPLPDSVQEQLDDAVAIGFDGCIVYIDQAGQAPTYLAAGYHDRKKEITAYPEALFKMASISKLYHAVAITKLVKSGRLSLDKTVDDYFPELKGKIENSDRITLKMLVQHRSGIPNYTEHPGYWADPPRSREENLQLVLNLPARFEPDQGFEYSNTNYLLIRTLLDRTLGYSRHRYIQETILQPLQLENTFSSLDAVDPEDVMSGYFEGYDGDLKMDDYGMLATARDVGVFLRALNDGSVFANGEREIYTSIYQLEHTGWVPGYQSMARYHQDTDTVVIFFVNSTGGYNWNIMEVVYNRILSILEKNKDAG